MGGYFDCIVCISISISISTSTLPDIRYADSGTITEAFLSLLPHELPFLSFFLCSNNAFKPSAFRTRVAVFRSSVLIFSAYWAGVRPPGGVFVSVVLFEFELEWPPWPTDAVWVLLFSGFMGLDIVLLSLLFRVNALVASWAWCMLWRGDIYKGRKAGLKIQLWCVR